MGGGLVLPRLSQQGFSLCAWWKRLGFLAQALGLFREPFFQ
jgi:hypothetical protein